MGGIEAFPIAIPPGFPGVADALGEGALIPRLSCEILRVSCDLVAFTRLGILFRCRFGLGFLWKSEAGS